MIMDGEKDSPPVQETDAQATSAPDTNENDSTQTTISKETTEITETKQVVEAKEPQAPSSPTPPRPTSVSTTTVALEKFYRVTKERVLQKIGKSFEVNTTQKTGEDQLKVRREKLYETRDEYDKLLQLGQKFTEQYAQLIQTTKALGNLFNERSVRDKDNGQVMKQLAECFKTIARNEENYLAQNERFFMTIDTFKNKAIEDTLETERKYEQARLERDAYQAKYDEYKAQNSEKAEHAKQEAQEYAKKYDQLKSDFEVKLNLLEEKRIADTRHQYDVYLKNHISFYSDVSKNLSQLQ